MKNSTRHVLTKIAIMMMLIFVGLPCTVKKAIKQELNIPVNSSGIVVKPNENIVCHSFAMEEVVKNATSYQITALPIQDADRYFSCFSGYNLQPVPLSVSSISLSETVPLYILHEQYLI